MMKKLLCLSACFILFSSLKLNAQALDINTFFNGLMYSFFSADSNNYMLNECKTQLSLQRTLDSVFKLPTGSFYNAVNKISYTGNRQFLQGLHNQVPVYDTVFKECSIDFTYGGIQSSAYSFFIQSVGDTNTAFLVMPGTGTFESFNIASGKPSNYHNQSCILKNMLKQRGDVYIYVKQNEEFRSIWKNYYNGGTFPKLNYDVLDPYTKLNGRDWQDNLFSEINVWTHFLKQKYKRVVIMGLSAGGWPPLFSSLQMKPDACFISAGFSAASYQNFPVPNNVNSILDGVLSVYTMDSLRKSIRTSTTEYLFAAGAQDNGVNLYEYQTHALKDSLEKPTPVANLNFSYFNGGHTFHCPSLDTFLNRVLTKPKSIVHIIDSVCHPDSMRIQVELIGQAPFSFALYKNNVWYANYTSITNTIDITLLDEGEYQIKDLDDNGSHPGYNGDLFVFKKDADYTFQLIANYYDCINEESKLTFQFGSSGPWIVQYTYNSVPYTDTIYGTNHTFGFQNGNVNFESLSNLSGCTTSILQSYTISNEPLSIAPLTPYYNCDSSKTNIHFQLQGNLPWLVNYLYNGNYYQETITTPSHDILLGNGSYSFINVSDAKGCVVDINQGFAFNYEPVSILLTDPIFDCDSNKTQVDFMLNGNSPFNIQYTKNSVNENFVSSNFTEKYFGNGYYSFQQVTDATGCISPINVAHYFQANILDVLTSAPIYNCDSNKTKINFTLSGRSPWKINYLKNGVQYQATTSNMLFDLFLDNGNYFLQNVIDSTLCEKAINQSYLFNYLPISANSSTPVYDCDSNKTKIDFVLQGNQPFTINYTKDGVGQSINSVGSNTHFFANALYNFTTVSDATGCSTSLNTTHLFNRELVDINLGTPQYNCDSNKTSIHFDVNGTPPYTLYYFENLIPKQFLAASNTFDLYFSDGSFLFQRVVDSTGCEKSINQLHQFNFQPITAIITQQAYNCDSNKYMVRFAFAGTSPYILEYTDGANVFTKTTTQPSLDLFLGNGNWVINKVSNNVGCVQYFNTPLSISYSSINGQIISQAYDCDSTKLKVEFALSGNPPWNIHYVINGSLPVYTSLTTYNANQSIYLPKGNYTFLTIVDSTGCNAAPLFQTANNDYDVLTMSKMSEAINCDSLKTKIEYKFTGNAPWYLTYKNLTTGTNTTLLSYDSILSLFLSNGNYQLVSLQDANCSINLSDTLILLYQSIFATHTTPTVYCDSNKFTTKLIVTGGIKPYHFDYYHNANQQSAVSNLDTTMLYLSNGNYLFATVTDSIGCSYNINESAQVTYNDFIYRNVVATYDCEKDSSLIALDIDRVDSLWLVYSKDLAKTDTIVLNTNNNFSGSNGTYNFIAIYDQYGCLDTINRALTINESPVDMQFVAISKDCEERNYTYSFALQGKSAWQLMYNGNDIFDTLYISTDTFNWTVPAGKYYFANVMDANNCIYVINKLDTLDAFLPLQPGLKYEQQKLVTIAGAAIYRWYKNGTLLATTNSNIILTQGDGDYSVVLEDSEGCFYSSSILNIKSDEVIVLYPNPGHHRTTVLVNQDYGKYWDYVISDMVGNKIMNGSSENATKELDIQGLPVGAYNMMIMFESDFSKYYIRFQKN